LSETVAGGVQQVAYFEGIPVLQLLQAADEPAGFLCVREGLDRAAVGVQICRDHAADDDHRVDIAGFGGLAPKIAALQADVDQAACEFGL